MKFSISFTLVNFTFIQFHSDETARSYKSFQLYEGSSASEENSPPIREPLLRSALVLVGCVSCNPLVKWTALSKTAS